jgi:hypothetical protein
MKLTGIIAISGRPGLFKVVAQGKNNVIVESLIDQKRIPAYATDKISALEDISIYTYDEDAPLQGILASIYEKQEGKEGPSHKEDLSTLEAYLHGILPNYDQERVYPSDIKKIFQWYNLLLKSGALTTEESVDNEVAESEEKPKAEAKKAVAKKATAKAATPDKAKAAKPASAKKVTAVKTGSSRGK